MRRFWVRGADAFQFGSLHGVRDAPHMRLELLEKFGLLDDYFVEFIMKPFDVRKVRFDALKSPLEVALFHSM